jgi:glucan biosynthesis protein C
VLFVAGILASRRGWLQTLPTRTGLAWLTVGVGASALRYAYSFAWPAGPGWLPAIAGGGFSSESLLWSAWELLICVGLGLGLVVLLRERAATPGRLARWAAPNAFGAYVVHVLPVVGLQLALASATLPPLGKFALVAAAAVPLSFGLAAGLRRLPGVRSVL